MKKAARRKTLKEIRKEERDRICRAAAWSALGRLFTDPVGPKKARKK